MKKMIKDDLSIKTTANQWDTYYTTVSFFITIYTFGMKFNGYAFLWKWFYKNINQNEKQTKNNPSQATEFMAQGFTMYSLYSYSKRSILKG